MKFIFHYAKKYWVSVFLMLVFIILSAKIDMELPKYTGKLISEGVAKKDLAVIYATGFEMIGLSLFSGAIMLASIFFASRSAGAIARDIRRDIFTKIEDFSMNEFGKFSVASLMARITNDARQFQQTFTMAMRMGVYAPFVGIGAIINVWSISGQMSWVVGGTIFAIIAMTIFISIFAMPKIEVSRKLVDKMNLQSRQIITGTRVIRAYQKDKIEQDKFSKINKENLKLNIFLERIFGVISPWLTLVSGLSLVAIAWIGSYLVKDDSILVGDIFSLIQYISQITFAFTMLSMLFVFLPRMFVSINRMKEVLNTDISVKDRKKTRKLPTEFSIEFKDVSFKYQGGEDYVLEDISFKVKQGETIAVIGGTGSGKSTIAKLIPRFYDISKGKILIGGVDIKELSQKELRKLIGYAPQKAMLFAGDIRSNISYGSDLTDEQIIEALKIAQGWEFVQKLPEDISSPVEQGGKNFSGGQKQRLSISRAIAKNSPIMIFDDSFSALDYQTDAKLRAQLALKTKKRTKFIVAQRIATIMDADKIVVLDSGRIVGIGKHEELLKENEVYKQIASSQLSVEELTTSQKGKE